MKSQKGAISVAGAIVLTITLALLVVGLVAYNNHLKKAESEERRAEERARLERENIERVERERRLKEEEEFERKKREARLASEKEEEEREAAEQERKRKAKEADADRQKAIADANKWRREYRVVQNKFAMTFGAVKDAPVDENPFRVTEEKLFWCVFASYCEDKLIYEIKAKPGGNMTVVALSADAAPQQMDSSTFTDRLKKERVAVTSGGQVWITGSVMPSTAVYDVPERGHDFIILESNLKGFYKTVVAMGMKVPDLKFNVYLRPKNKKTNISLGTVGCNEPLERSRIETAIASQIAASTQRKMSYSSKVRKPSFKRTVILYDGTYIKKEMGGVTKVPREYNYIGTTRYKSDNMRTEAAFREKWQALHDEAVRQEKKAREIEEEYAAAVAREKLEHELREASTTSLPKDDKIIDAALTKYSLIIEIEKPTQKRE